MVTAREDLQRVQVVQRDTMHVCGTFKCLSCKIFGSLTRESCLQIPIFCAGMTILGFCHCLW